MNTEFFSLSFSREEVRELHEALLLRSMVEDELRREQGLEPVAMRPLLARVEQLLNLSDKQVERITERLDTGLWEHAWYVFTDEWAWYRARQDVEKELNGSPISEQDMRERMEQKYHDEFERYVREVEMKDPTPTPPRPAR